MALESKTAGAKKHAQQAIDTVLATLYANDARGYMGVDAKVLKDAAFKRIRSELSTLDKKARPEVEHNTMYRIEEFEGFSHMPDSVRRDVLRIAKEKHLSIEEANRRLAKR